MKAILIGFLIGSIFFTHQASKEAHAREVLAQSWSEPTTYYAATGSSSRTLTVVMPYSGNQKALACSKWFSITVTDAHLVGELKAAGFTSAACSTETEPLP